jgi:hypothetical protein
VAALLNVLLTFVPRSATAAIATMAISATIIAYSTIVAPFCLLDFGVLLPKQIDDFFMMCSYSNFKNGLSLSLSNRSV